MYWKWCFIFSLLFRLSVLPMLSQALPIYNAAKEEEWLPKHFIRDIFQDAKGNLWIGTNAGLYKYNLHTLENINLTKKTNTQFLNNSIHNINEDKYGNILIGTESGLGILDITNGNCTIVSKTDETIAETISDTEGGIWWLTVNGNIYKVSSTNNQYGEAVLVAQIEKTKSSSNLTATTFIEGQGHDFLVGTSAGVFSIDKNTLKISSSFTENTTVLLKDSKQNIWVGTNKEGLFLFKKDKATYQKINISEDNAHISDIKDMGDGQIVVTTVRHVYLVSFSENETVAQKVVESVFPSREGHITSVCTDLTQNLWLGSPIGLYKIKRNDVQVDYLSPDSKEFFPNNQINDLSVDDVGQLWMMTSLDGIYTLNTTTQKQQKRAFPFKNVRLMHQSQAGNTILVSGSKIFEQNTEGGVLKPIYEGKGTLTDILEVAAGEWWATTWNFGLIRFNESYQTATHTRSLYDKIISVLPKDARLYCLLKDSEKIYG